VPLMHRDCYLGLGNPDAVENTWMQLLLPYVKSKNLFVCPSYGHLGLVEAAANNYLQWSNDQEIAGGYAPLWAVMAEWVPTNSAGVNGDPVWNCIRSCDPGNPLPIPPPAMASIANPSQYILLVDSNTDASQIQDLSPPVCQSACWTIAWCQPDYWGGGFDWTTCNFRISLRHNEGSNYLLADGHAKWMKKAPFAWWYMNP